MTPVEPDFGAVSDRDLETLMDKTSELIDHLEESNARLPRAYGRILRRFEQQIADELVNRGLISEDELTEVDVEVVIIPDNFENPEPLSAKSAFADFVNSLDLDDFEDDDHE